MPAGMASVINHAVSRHYLSWRTSPRVWGDGFADLSLSTSLYPRDWSDVSDDELVLFFSHLSGQDHPELGIAARLRAAYARRVRASAILRAENGANLSERTAADGRHLDDDLAMAPPSPEELAIAELFALDLARPPWASEAAIIGAIECSAKLVRQAERPRTLTRHYSPRSIPPLTRHTSIRRMPLPTKCWRPEHGSARS